MTVPAVRFGAVFVAPQTAASALNAITYNRQFREQGPVRSSMMGRQFLASLTGVMRICEGNAAVYYKSADLQGLPSPYAKQFLLEKGVSQGDLLVVTGASVGDVLPNETPEQFVLKQLMIKPQDVHQLSQQQVELALDSVTSLYRGKIPVSLMADLQRLHQVAHGMEHSDPKRAIADPSFLVNWQLTRGGDNVPYIAIPGAEYPAALFQQPAYGQRELLPSPGTLLNAVA
ncbi:MAG: hypothetical protein VKJ04_12245 [Vampirovibrionales bacterium]|nr:hypothetical protein [Vampirovibrionales bacterium]